MTETTEKQTHSFQAEVQQILNLMIHSLYSNKEIFLRELISNASDACDKLRFESLTDAGLLADDADLRIRIDADHTARTVTITDNGVGMDFDELVANLGTIARSGTREFLSRLSGDEARDARLIGQFGVGFYSSFVVADKVTVTSRRAGSDTAHVWESEGSGEYTIEPVESAPRGTSVTLHLRPEEDEFLEHLRLLAVIKKYSDHIAIPVEMREDGDAGKDYAAVNQSSALWTRAKSDISDEQYAEFYKHVAHDFEDPLAWSHNRVEGRLEYTSLLYVPARRPFDLWHQEARHGVKLFVQRVFIMDDAEQLMPRYLRFVRGVIDSSDLPLNVSREILQSSSTVDSIRAGSAKKVLGLLQTMADEEPDKYQKFWDQFGAVMKEGPAEDLANRDAVAKLLRFASTGAEGDIQNVSLDEYIGRMKDGQEAIYYITAESLAAARNSPHLEIFRKRNVEVLLLTDRIDEWLVAHLTDYREKPFRSVAQGELKLDDDSTDETAEKALNEEFRDLTARMHSVLRERVKDVRVSRRLTDSPTCLVTEEGTMSAHLARMLKDAGQAVPVGQPILEINPSHPMILKLKTGDDKDRLRDWSTMLFEQAVLAEGGQLEDPASFVKRVNDAILSLTG